MTNILKIQHLNYSIPYSVTLLEDVSFELQSGEFLGILGHNGAGKTTLMDLLMGYRNKTSGVLEVFGENPHDIERQNRNKIVFLSQEVSLKGNLTIGDFLKFHASFFSDYDLNEQLHLMQVFNLKLNMKIGSLSTGQQKKVQVVAGLSSKPKLILIDEITAVMDPETRSIFFIEIERVREEGVAVILATNIAEDLVERCDRILFIADKKSSIHRPQEISALFNLKKAA